MINAHNRKSLIKWSGNAPVYSREFPIIILLSWKDAKCFILFTQVFLSPQMYFFNQVQHDFDIVTFVKLVFIKACRMLSRWQRLWLSTVLGSSPGITAIPNPWLCLKRNVIKVLAVFLKRLMSIEGWVTISVAGTQVTILFLLLPCRLPCNAINFSLCDTFLLS